ncbi:hypothetical protein DL240_14935 [Lujinxingia litoralis]|uniref:Uncharacterized protein n=1 Tax=Lujinxingia litoralis TaxID=2211119 RepID=A0A328C8J8_9DELT|nr:hypothetical protein DL240_14935 [Lujinxingia litoralis]
MTGSHMTGSHMTGSHMTGSRMTGSRMTGSHMTGSHMTGSHMTGSHMTGSRMTGSHMTGSPFPTFSLSPTAPRAPPLREPVRMDAVRPDARPETTGNYRRWSAARGRATLACQSRALEVRERLHRGGA